jgi:hypothetical protein
MSSFATFRKLTLSTLVLVATVLIMTKPCYAHSFHPVFWGLGPLAPMAAVLSGLGCIPLAAIIVTQALLLYLTTPLPFISSLWRVAIIFPICKVAETLPLLINPDEMMGPRSATEFKLIIFLMVLAALVANAVMIVILCQGRRPRALTILWLSFAFEVLSCGGLYVTILGLVHAGILH